MNRLTEQKAHALLRANKPGTTAIGDGTGLCLRITKSGSSWQLRYRFEGKAHWLTIGAFPGCSLVDAKKRATSERARIGQGVNPVAERRRNRMTLKAAKTFRDLWLDYKSRALLDLAEVTQNHRSGYCESVILPLIGDLRVETVSGGVIVAMTERIAKQRTDIAARKCFSLVSIIFDHALAKHLATSNPCIGLRLNAILGKKRPIRRTTSLTEAELRSVFTKLPNIGERNAIAVRIILACCVRKQELRKARPQDLDLDRGLWTIPGEHSKNRKEFVIPLAPIVVGWFRELLRLSHGAEWLLPGMDRHRPMSDSTLNMALGRLEADTSRFTVHDLRRTARTHLGKLGVDVITAEKCLNHKLGGLIDVYDRGDYLPERRRALELWADFLVRCESPSGNVVSLRQAG